MRQIRRVLFKPPLVNLIKSFRNCPFAQPYFLDRMPLRMAALSANTENGTWEKQTRNLFSGHKMVHGEAGKERKRTKKSIPCQHQNEPIYDVCPVSRTNAQASFKKSLLSGTLFYSAAFRLIHVNMCVEFKNHNFKLACLSKFSRKAQKTGKIEGTFAKKLL